MTDTSRDVADARIDLMKNEIVRARLALHGVTDPSKIAAVAQRMTVTRDGEVIGLDAQGRVGVGTGPGYHISEADILAETGEAPAADTATNPFKAGPHYSLTAGMILFRENPELAERLMSEAGLKFGGAR